MNENFQVDSFTPDATLSNGDSTSGRQAYQIQVANQQSVLPIVEEPLIRAARLILEDRRYSSATLSIAVVDDLTIHALNNQFLRHDYPTDVLSFVLEESAAHLEGEVIVSSETAIRGAVQAHWSPSDELLLYVIHGVLHLVGHGDKEPDDEVEMHAAEAHYLRRLGVSLPVSLSRWSSARKESLT